MSFLRPHYPKDTRSVETERFAPAEKEKTNDMTRPFDLVELHEATAASLFDVKEKPSLRELLSFFERAPIGSLINIRGGIASAVANDSRAVRGKMFIRLGPTVTSQWRRLRTITYAAVLLIPDNAIVSTLPSAVSFGASMYNKRRFTVDRGRWQMLLLMYGQSPVLGLVTGAKGGLTPSELDLSHVTLTLGLVYGFRVPLETQH
jgi:hypothetical protein